MSDNYRIYVLRDGWVFIGNLVGETSWEVLLENVEVLERNNEAGSLLYGIIGNQAKKCIALTKSEIRFSVATD